MFKKIKENKVLKIIGNILYTIFFIIVILMLIVVILQRVSNNNNSLKGYRIFTVVTGSMEPKYKVNDILVAKEISPSDIKLEDDVVYKGKEGSVKDKFVTHQVIDIREDNGKYNFTTKGIANPEKDPEISEEQVYGKIVYKVKSLSFISDLISSDIRIFYFFVFVPIAIIIYNQIRNLISNNEEDDDEK